MACFSELPPGRFPFQLDITLGLALTLEDTGYVLVRSLDSAHDGRVFETS
jgi:hypothetical protein